MSLPCCSKSVGLVGGGWEEDGSRVDVGVERQVGQ